MYRAQREYDCSGALRNAGGEQESSCELHNYQDEMMADNLNQSNYSPSLAKSDDGHIVPTANCL